MKCPTCNVEGSNVIALAPDEEWCTSCDSILQQMPDGTVKAWSGTRLMVEGL
jgi:hypothetical protein